MPRHNVTLTAVFDDIARTVTLTGSAPPPPGPADVPEYLWFGQTGAGFEVTINVQAKNITANPTAEYMKVGSDGNTVERYRVEYANGAWQMPGTKITQ